MGNFVIVVPAMRAAIEAKRLFRASLGSALEIRSQVPGKTAESDWALAVSFPRQNGSGSPLVTDASIGR